MTVLTLKIIACVFSLPFLGHLWYWCWSPFNPRCPLCSSDALIDRARLGGYRFAIVGEGSEGVAACYKGHMFHAKSGVVLAMVRLNSAINVLHDQIEMTTEALFYDDEGRRHDAD